MISNHTLPRRQFVKTAAGFAAAAGAVGFYPGMLAAEKPKWPVGCRDVYLQHAGTRDSWAAMKELGAEGIEVQVELDLACPNLFHHQRKYTLATAEGVLALANDLEESGCRIASFMMANHLDERLEREIAWTSALVKAASQLRIHTIRIDVVPRKLAGDEFLRFAIDACKRICDTAAGTPIRFGIENHGKVTNDPEFLQRLFDGVNSDKLGLTLDCANFYWWGHPEQDLYRIYEQFASRTVHTHCKSIRYPAEKRNVRREIGWEYSKYAAPIHEGDIDYTRVVKILRKANYQGDLCVEDESLGKAPAEKRGEILKQEIAFLKRLV